MFELTSKVRQTVCIVFSEQRTLLTQYYNYYYYPFTLLVDINYN